MIENSLKSAGVLAFCLLAAPAAAEDMALGAEDFAGRCAVCHGASGDGSGAVGELFAQKPKDLRILARENGGVFPIESVVASIDGRAAIAGHGSSEMPIWGEYLMVEALEDRGINPKDARMIVDGRILALTSYIQGLQVE